MYRIIFSGLIVIGIFNNVCAQSKEGTVKEAGPLPIKTASFIIEKLNPQLSEIKLPGSGLSYKYSLDLPNTKAVVPEAIQTETRWINDGKNNSKLISFETINYVQLVPLLVATLQDQQAQINDLKKQLESLRKESEKTDK
jgi:hypothetical protein